jgi:hypothetical protein
MPVFRLMYFHPRHVLELQRNSRLPHRAGARQGTSLLEVMFAMGVAIIGLLGVAALLPVAAHRMGRGLQADQIGAYGRAVVAEFDIRGMGQRRLFTWRNPNNGNFERFNQPGAFCLDPVVVSELPAMNVFPSTPNSYNIPRVTLRRFSNLANNPLIQATLIDGLFRFDDDLVFNRPIDRTLPAVQLYSSDPVPSQPIKRQYNGRFTWMATLSPSQTPTAPDLYTLSVVVFDGRDPDPANEVVMPIELGTGLGGGDVVFGQPISGHALVDVDLRPDDWVMLSPQTTPRYVRWYRVASVDREVVGPGKHGYLRGADWDRTVDTQATFIKGVVGVFEKTFRLEDSSLWKIR